MSDSISSAAPQPEDTLSRPESPSIRLSIPPPPTLSSSGTPGVLVNPADLTTVKQANLRAPEERIPPLLRAELQLCSSSVRCSHGCNVPAPEPFITEILACMLDLPSLVSPLCGRQLHRVDEKKARPSAGRMCCSGCRTQTKWRRPQTATLSARNQRRGKVKLGGSPRGLSALTPVYSGGVFLLLGDAARLCPGYFKTR